MSVDIRGTSRFLLNATQQVAGRQLMLRSPQAVCWPSKLFVGQASCLLAKPRAYLAGDTKKARQ